MRVVAIALIERSPGGTMYKAMDDLELIATLQAAEGPLVYLTLAMAALVEYVVPPFPGDTVALAGVFLAATAGWSPLCVHLALTAGSIVGGLMAWFFGRWLAAHQQQWPRFLQGPRTEEALAEVRRRFERHGPAYLVLNRFLPALRAFFFVGAGLSGTSALAVAIWGGVSAALWNGLLLAAGYLVGENWERLQGVYRLYGLVVLGIVGGGVLLWGWLRLRRMRRA